MRRVLTTNPRSGTHYLKFLISSALGSHPVEEVFPRAEDLDANLSSANGDRLVYGHFRFTEFSPVLDPRKYLDLRLLVLTRHPLDRMISQIAYETALDGRVPSRAKTPRQLVRELMLGQWDGRPWEDGFTVDDYAAIHNHYLREFVSDWLEARTCLMVRFEDLIARPEEVLSECLDHLQVSAPRSRIRQTVEAVTFMTLSNGRQPGQADPMSHYRCGIPGEWRHVFAPEDIEIMRPRYAQAFARAGYVL